MATKINTILFDLDGTLLPMDSDMFMKVYFGEMTKKFEDLIEKDKLVKYVWAATSEMVKNVEERTNEEVFMEKFSSLIEEELETYTSRFDAFYDEEFHKVKVSVFPNEWVRKSVDLLLEKGYKLAVATNPLFPKKAILHRINWANLEPGNFEYIASYESNHYCKPQIQYYKEILNEIGKMPSECMMVGNDVQEDMIAGTLGMKTFLIDTHIIHRTEDPIVCDYKGNYEAFYKFVTELPNVAE